MALAAAIKLYPVIFALLWLAAGRKQSVVRFAILGGALGLVSLAVGGWPQHAAFLSELHAISSSAVITFPNVTMDSLLAVLLIDPASTELITTEATGGKTSWRIFAKPALWQGMNVIVQLTTISLLTVFSIRTRLADPLVWPVIFVALAWVLPLSWLYHYLTAFAFLPALVARLGWKRGIYAMSVPALVTSTAFFVLTLSLPAGKIIAYSVMSGAMVWMGLVLLWTIRQSAWKPPLRTTSQPL
jgi:alpha-1,2-mannosyltransferase